MGLEAHCYPLRNIASVGKHLDVWTIEILLHNYAIWKLDYSNSLFCGLPNYQLRKLQNIMNRTARLIQGLLTSIYWFHTGYVRVKQNKTKKIVYKISPSFDFLGGILYISSLLWDLQVDIPTELSQCWKIGWTNQEVTWTWVLWYLNGAAHP